MKSTATLALLGVIFAASAAHAGGAERSSHDHTEPTAAAHHAHDAPVNIPAGGALQPPRLEIEVLEDPMSGWNLHVATSEFRFAPEHVSGPHHAGEGHAHLYVDGKKITRLYGPWYHLGNLTPGKHEITVQISANNHAPYAYKGQLIRESVVIDVQK